MVHWKQSVSIFCISKKESRTSSKVLKQGWLGVCLEWCNVPNSSLLLPDIVAISSIRATPTFASMDAQIVVSYHAHVASPAIHPRKANALPSEWVTCGLGGSYWVTVARQAATGCQVIMIQFTFSALVSRYTRMAQAQA